MELILAAVTVIALALAAVMAVMLMRMSREERRRSDARVALLQDLAAEPSSFETSHIQRSPKTTRKPALARPIVPSTAMFSADDLELHPTSRSEAVRAELFQLDAEPSAWPRRIGVAAALSITIAFASLVLTWNSSPRSTAQPPAAVSFRPLELVSLEHVQESGTLTITGLVQNPRAGVALTGVEATVLVYDRAGAMLANGRTPIDIRMLSPGDESPFVIRVPVNGTVARYRIGFRGPDDRVLGHVDRRTPASVARRQDP